MIKRKLLKELAAHLAAPEISLLVGARQIGKTTLMEQLRHDLAAQGARTLYLNLDFEADAAHFSSQDALIHKIMLEIGLEKGYIFIDEIQRKANAGLFLKGIYDQKLPYKLVCSGSGSLELKEQIHESLVGRKRIFELYPVSFLEYFHYHTGYRYEANWRDFLESHPQKCKSLLSDYLAFGGYPRVVTEERHSEKQRIMDDIFRSYIDRDIIALLRLEKRDAFNRMIQLAASQIGGLVNISQWAAHCGVAAATLQTYLWYAQRTYILRSLSPYHSNLGKEIVKSPIIYFCDLGLRNFSVGLFGPLLHQRESSFLFQNMIFNMLIEWIQWQSWTLHFWRTTDKAEVDFVLDLKHSLLPIEAKFTDMKKTQIGRSMMSFIQKYKPAEAWIINLSLRAEVQANGTRVRFMPFYELADGEQIPGRTG
jgi:uncharacterized protein